MNRPLILSLCIALFTVILAGQAVSQDCQWTSIGPTNKNGRITGIAINPRNPDQIFATSVGGVWRSDDGGRRWQRLSDEFIAIPKVVSSVVINPISPNEVFVGGGDPNYRSKGGGIWRSGDGGHSWMKISDAALDRTVIMRLRIDPEPPHDLYAATMSGVYVGTAGAGGSRSWSRLRGFDLREFDPPVSDMVVDFDSTPPKVYVGALEDTASFMRGIWKYDGDWHKRDSGIPAEIGHVALAMSETDHHNILYAKIERRGTSTLLGVYKTVTGGDAWRNLPGAAVIDGGQTSYNNSIEVDPNNSSVVWAGDVGCFRSTDGGLTWDTVRDGRDRSYPLGLHDDEHAIAFDPRNSKIVFIGTDGGIYKSTDTSLASWHWNESSHGMVITEFYDVASQQSLPTMAAGGTQDNGVNFTYGNRAWYNVASCDGHQGLNAIAIDGENSNTLHYTRFCAGDDAFQTSANPVFLSEGGTSIIVPRFPPGSGIITPFSPVTTDFSIGGAALSSGKLDSGRSVLLKTSDALNWTKIGHSTPEGTIKAIAIGPSSHFRTYYAAIYVGSAATIWRYIPIVHGTRVEERNSGIPANKEPTGLAVDYTNNSRAFATIGVHGDGEVLLTMDGEARGEAHWVSLPGTAPTALPSTSIYGIVIDPFDPNTVYVATAVGVYRGQITKSSGGSFSASWVAFNQGIPDGIDVHGIWVNPRIGVLYIGTVGYGAYQRDIRPGATCRSTMLVVRDNVLDRGLESPNGVPDPEHPIFVPETTRPGGFFKPDDTVAGRLYRWQSTDIRIDVPSIDLPSNSFPETGRGPDSVEFESCPIEHRTCEAGQLVDRSPIRGQHAVAYVQVTNRGPNPSGRVRVVLLWADATTGLPPLPDDFWTTTFPAGRLTCGPLSAGSAWNAVDPSRPCRTIETVAPAMPEVVRFPWEVPTTAAEHSCMIAIIDSDDDPIPDAVHRSSDPTADRHVAVRNLHVVDGPADGGPVRGSDALNVPNPGLVDQRPIDLFFSKAGMPAEGKLAVLLPPLKLKSVSLRGVRKIPVTLSTEERRKFGRLGLDTSMAYQLTQQEGVIGSLVIRPGTTWKIGILYNTVKRGRPNSAARFSVLARQGTKVLGGSTYVLRYGGR